MARRPPPPVGSLFTLRDKPFSRRYGLGAERERQLPSPKETEAQRAWVAELRRTNLLKPDWRWTRIPAGDVADAKWAGVMVSLGLNPGWPDLIFAAPWTASSHAKLHGMEWKRGPGEELRDEQAEMRQWFVLAGWGWETVWDATTAWKALQGWGALRMEMRF